MARLDDLLLKIKDRRLVVIVVPIAAGAFLGWVAVVKPSLARLSTLRSQKSELSSKAAAFNDILGWETKLAAYKKRLAPIEDKAKTIEDLGTAATATGLSVSSIAPDEKKAVGAYLERVSVRIDAEGNYHQLGEFVSRVESMDSFVKILGVLINASPDTVIDSSSGPSNRPKKAGANSYKISINVGLFYAPKDAL